LGIHRTLFLIFPWWQRSRGGLFLASGGASVVVNTGPCVLLFATLVQHAGRHGCARGGKSELARRILNDLPDRISDVLIFAGVAHSGLNAVISGYWRRFFALLTAYVGVFGQAVGVQREFSGAMSKPWRMVTLHLGAWITLGLIWWNAGSIHFGGLTVLDWPAPSWWRDAPRQSGYGSGAPCERCGRNRIPANVESCHPDWHCKAKFFERIFLSWSRC